MFARLSIFQQDNCIFQQDNCIDKIQQDNCIGW